MRFCNKNIVLRFVLHETLQQNTLLRSSSILHESLQQTHSSETFLYHCHLAPAMSALQELLCMELMMLSISSIKIVVLDTFEHFGSAALHGF